MELFNEALTKAKEAIEVAYKKTGEVVTTQKQKIDVATLENKCNKVYAALGKLYFDETKDSTDLDIETKALVLDIKNYLSKIESLKSEINAAKKLKNCPNCNATINETDIFCPICGSKTVTESEEK